MAKQKITINSVSTSDPGEIVNQVIDALNKNRNSDKETLIKALDKALEFQGDIMTFYAVIEGSSDVVDLLGKTVEVSHD